ncbi:MAG: hypothetical protein V3U96_03770 [Paracoccaceae bacterium]
MSGNAMEEGLILQIHNPSHLDPSRLGFLVGAVSGIGALFALSAVAPNMPRIISVYLALAVVAAVGTLVTCSIAGARKRRKVDALIAARAMHEAETKRKIAQMQAMKG